MVMHPTFTGVDDDSDTKTDEETPNGIDDDVPLAGKIDEDSAKLSPGNPAQRIQHTWAVKFNSSEAGDMDKKWALYWKGHLATGSSGFPGASLHTNTSATGGQDVPVKVNPPVGPPEPPDLFIQKECVPIDPEGIQPGKHVKCTLTYGNTGGSDALNVMIVDDYDETYIDNRPGNVPTNITGGGVDDGDKITWTIGTVTAMSGPFTQMYEYRIHDETPDTEAHMPVGDGIDNDGDGQIDEEILNGVDDEGDGLIDEDTGATAIINKATISSSPADSDPSDNMALEVITVHAEPNLFVVKTVDKTTVNVGDIITITLTYGNANHNDAPNVLLCDDYNQLFMQPIAASITGGGVDDGDKICWGFGVTPPGTLPGTFPAGTDTLPGLDPVVSYQATILAPPPQHNNRYGDDFYIRSRASF